MNNINKVSLVGLDNKQFGDFVCQRNYLAVYLSQQLDVYSLSVVDLRNGKYLEQIQYNKCDFDILQNKCVAYALELLRKAEANVNNEVETTSRIRIILRIPDIKIGEEVIQFQDGILIVGDIESDVIYNNEIKDEQLVLVDAEYLRALYSKLTNSFRNTNMLNLMQANEKQQANIQTQIEKIFAHTKSEQ